jgi:N-acyl-D-amino-acid deacylase
MSDPMPSRRSSDDGRRVDRRKLLQSLAVAGTLAVAGCSGSGGNGTTDGPPPETATPTKTATPTQSPTRTATPTETETTETEPPTADRPTTGSLPAELEPIDTAFRSFLVDNDVPGAALGVAKDGEVLLERGYGWKDEDRTVPTPPDARFRIASNTKPLTKVAVGLLVESGDLSLDTKAFQRLGLDPLPGDDPDDGVYEITVEHLLTHQGGLGPLRPVNPMFDIGLTFEMAERMNLSSPPTTRQRARFMLGQPLQFEPGTQKSYSNFGYAVLGLLVEEVSGSSLGEFVRSGVLDGAPPSAVYAGRTLPADRREGEVDYYSQRRVPNVYELARDERVPYPDGGFHLEALGGAGAFVARTRGLLPFLDEYWLNGKRRGDASDQMPFFGSLPGTFTMMYQHRSGLDLVALMNYRGPTPRGFIKPLQSTLDSGIKNVEI